MQGQLMAVRHGWRWLSAGQLLRDTSDPKIYEFLKQGQLVPDEYVNELTFFEIDKVHNDADIQHIILDGYPRTLEQAQKLTEHNRRYNADVSMVVVLDVSEDELLKRLRLRGRMEDDPETITGRLSRYDSATQPILDYFVEQNVPVEYIDGVGTVGEIHDRIEAALERNKVIGEF
jgi:adenylate kinase